MVNMATVVLVSHSVTLAVSRLVFQTLSRTLCSALNELIDTLLSTLPPPPLLLPLLEHHNSKQLNIRTKEVKREEREREKKT